MFLVVVNAETEEACFASDENCVPKQFSSEDDAVEEAKGYGDSVLILRAVGKVTEKTTHRYTKLK